MTVTINTLGSNSRQIVIDSETSATNIINAVNTSLTALGWTLIDTVTSGSRGCQTTKVYSAPNADTVTTKYMIIRYDLPRQYWFVSCAEGWNTSTNVATNECWYGNRQILLPLQYSNCSLYVFATARYACFLGVVSGEPSPWQGVFEFERYAAEDIAAKTVPCFGWTSSLTIGEPYGNILTPISNTLTSSTSTNNGCVAVGFSVPRTANNLTGNSAATVFNVLTSLGSFPPTKSQSGIDWSSGGITQTLNGHQGMLGTWGDSSTYVWDANKVPISNLQLNGYSSFYLVGRIYGLKITAKLGAVLDTTTVPVDASLFYSAGGSNTTHYLLGIHGGYNDKISAGTNKLTANVTTTVSNFGSVMQSVLVNGRFLYFTTAGTGAGFHKFDIQTQSLTLNILPAATYMAVKFDGENSLYVTSMTANIVYKINLSNDTNTTLSMTGTWSGMCIDDDNLYVGSSVAGSTTTVKQVSLSTFTEAASYTVNTGLSTNFITHMSNADYDGYVYVACLSSATGTSNRIVRIDRNSGTQISLTPAVNQYANVDYGCPLHYDGTYFWMITSRDSGGTSQGNHIRAARIRVSDFTISAEFVQSTTLNYTRLFGNGAMGNLGCCEPISFAGMQIIPKDYLASDIIKLQVNDPRTGLLTILPCNLHTMDSNNVSIGQYSTDQCSLYFFGSQKIVRYTNAFRTYNFNGVQSSNLLIAQ